MPMKDYTCSQCGYRFEEFNHHPPLEVPCPKLIEEGVQCASPARIRDSYPGEYRPTNARRFDPIVIYERSDGTFYFPSDPSDSTDRPASEPSAKRIEITNIAQADYYTNRVNSVEREIAQERMHNNELFFSEQTKIRREEQDQRFKSSGLSNSGHARQLLDMARRFRDAKHKRLYSKSNRRGPNFNINVIEYDSSNRNPYWDGQRQRKG